VTLSGNGQVSPDASNRRIVSRTVEGAEPTRQAISWLGIPVAFNLITSAHVAHRKPLRRHPGPPSHKPEGGTVSEPEEAVSPRGEIIPEWWATSSGISIRAAHLPRACRHGGGHRRWQFLKIS
jgi:hypothetical protein